MNLKTIRWVIALGIIAIVTIILSQVFWIRKGLLINQSNIKTADNKIAVGLTIFLPAISGAEP